MDLQSQLKELSFEMMKNEISKMQLANAVATDKRLGIGKSAFNASYTQTNYQYHLNQSDQKGYDLSLKFNDLLLSNGKKFNNFENGPDAAYIAAENLLNQFGLDYPISWHVIREDAAGLHFGYDLSEKVEQEKIAFLRKLDILFSEKKISEEEYTRLCSAANYFANHHKLLSKYFNQEDINIFGDEGPKKS